MWPFNGGLQRAFSGTAGELLVRKKKNECTSYHVLAKGMLLNQPNIC